MGRSTTALRALAGAWAQEVAGERERERERERGERERGGRARGSGREQQGEGPPEVVRLKHAEPAEGRVPVGQDWRVYALEGDEVLGTFYVAHRSCFLWGRDPRVADLPAEHPSCSKQHAVLQYLKGDGKGEGEGEGAAPVAPYVMDLGSAGGTRLNGVSLAPWRYHALASRDVLHFGARRARDNPTEWVVVLRGPDDQAQADDDDNDARGGGDGSLLIQ